MNLTLRPPTQKGAGKSVSRFPPACDWLTLRNLFPLLATGTYLDSANLGPVSSIAAAAAAGYYEESGARGDAAAPPWAAKLDQCRDAIARRIGTSADSIAFVTNTSSAITCAALLFEGQGAVLVARGEHPSVVTPWFARGYRVDVVEPDRDGSFPVERYAAALRPDTRVIAVSHVRYDDGQVADLTGLGALCRAQGAHLVVDAIQSMGVLPIPPEAEIDLLGFAGFKWMNAGHGSGAMFVRDGLLQRYGLPIAGNRSRRTNDLLQIDGLDPLLLPRAFELGTVGIPNQLALGASAALLERIGADAILGRIAELTTRLRNGLKTLGLRTATDAAAGIVTPIVSVAVEPVERVHAALEAAGVHVSLRAGRLRIAVSWYNDAADVDRCLAALETATR